MNWKEILAARLYNQQITLSNIKTVKDIVGQMGAIQAQDYAMAKLAIGIRLPGSNEASVNEAIDRGEILRTHLLRPTWHIVSADDIYWILELTAPQIKAIAKNQYKKLGLSPQVFKKSNNILQTSMAGGNYLTREELILLYNKAKIALDNNRLSLLLLQAEIDGLICSGPVKNNKQTYALLEERVPRPPPVTREHALKKLAEKYFFSRGPATLQDFIWWSGLSITEARHALEMAAPNLVMDAVDKNEYWFSESAGRIKNANTNVYLLPSFDEYMIGYKDRTSLLPAEYQRHTISDNGIFRPVIVVNGKITGLWSRVLKNKQAVIQTTFFQPHTEAHKAKIRTAIKRFGKFLNIETVWSKEK